MKPLAEIATAASLAQRRAWALDAPPVRRFPCTRCGADVGRNFWVCEECRPVESAAQRERALACAREQIPDRFRGVRLDSSCIFDRVDASPAVFYGARAALAGATAVASILGKTKSGKTSIACAMLTEVIDAGGALTAPASAFERARSAMYVDARLLAVARQEHPLGDDAPELIRRARRASVLVIDELGAEGRGTDIAQLIHEREAAARLTIVATWLDQRAIAAAYGGGIARRLFDGATVLCLGSSS